MTIKEQLTDEQLKLMDKYKIDYNVKTKKELLINIDDIMTDYVDNNDEPTDDFLAIEKLYDDIYREIPADITNKDEKYFLSHFGNNVRVILKDGNVVEGYCESFTRKEDSNYDDPELTIESKKGHIVVEFSDVKEIIDM